MEDIDTRAQNLIIIEPEAIIAMDIETELKDYYKTIQKYTSIEEAIKNMNPKKVYTIIVTEEMENSLKIKKTFNKFKDNENYNIVIFSERLDKQLENISSDNLVGIIKKADQGSEDIKKLLIEKGIISNPSEKYI